MMMNYVHTYIHAGVAAIFRGGERGLTALIVYTSYCFEHVSYCLARLPHTYMLYPVAIYTVLLLG